jgi:hypothetical protein
VIRLTLIVLIFIASACVPVSVNDLPGDPSEIDFSIAVDDQTGWRTGEKSHVFEDTDRDLVYTAAEAALLHADYEITTASPEEGAVVGKHGMTLTRLSMVAGIYLQQSETDTQIRIIVKSSVDLTAVPAYPVADEARELFQDMSRFIEAEIGAEPNGESR